MSVRLSSAFGEGAAIISRMHHCITDGIALSPGTPACPRSGTVPS
jgi:hypothetical protein